MQKQKYSSNNGTTFTACPNPYKKESSSSILLTTGADNSFSVQNIYDIAGNVDEWTLENTSNTNCPCAPREGFYLTTGSSLPASNYVNRDATSSLGFVRGFRVSLY